MGLFPGVPERLAAPGTANAASALRSHPKKTTGHPFQRKKRKRLLVQSILFVHVEIVGDLKQCDRVLFSLQVGIPGLQSGTHLRALWIARIILRSLVQTENNEFFRFIQTDVTVVIQKDPPTAPRVLEQITPEKQRFVRTPQDSKQGRRHIQRTPEGIHPARRLDERGPTISHGIS